VLLEGVGDVFEENQTQNDVLVFRSVHIVAELVGGQPELGFKSDGGGRGVLRRGFSFGRHGRVEARVTDGGTANAAPSPLSDPVYAFPTHLTS